FPDCRLEPVAEPELAAIRRQFPGVPEHYLAVLRRIGYGSLGGAFMIYGGPVEPGEIFGPGRAAGLEGRGFFRASLGGTLFGFDTRNDWRLVGVDDHTLEVNPEGAGPVGEFLARWLAEQEGAGPDGV